jgi:condensin complex subunit 2
MTSGLQEVPKTPRPSNSGEAQKFNTVIDNLRRTYPKDKMEEISTSFCFICLLHLANEHGLKIEGEAPNQILDDDDDDDDDDEADRRKLDYNKVGSLWGLKVSKDPNVQVT